MEQDTVIRCWRKVAEEAQDDDMVDFIDYGLACAHDDSKGTPPPTPRWVSRAKLVAAFLLGLIAGQALAGCDIGPRRFRARRHEVVVSRPVKR